MKPGDTLGPYRVLDVLGVGGMGEVYRARDTRLDRTVALKVLPPAIQQDPERQARFEREAKAISQLNHPHICTLYDIGRGVPTSEAERREGGEADRSAVDYLVMELLEGDTLAVRLERGPLPMAQALELGAQIADALDAAHRHGIVHRDLKPGNVMLISGGSGRSGVTTAKLLDFGLAKLTAHGERPVFEGSASAPTVAPATAEGTILGTLPYMAPEQLEGRPADARTDLWALGAIVYEMLAGRRAFEGASQLSLIGSIMNAEPPALSAVQPLTPPALDRVVRKCLAKHPDGRWDSARDVADELRWIAQTAATGAERPWRPGARLLAAALLIFAAGAGVMWVLRPAEPAVRVHATLDVRPADEVHAVGANSLSDNTPGGSRTAFAWTPDGQALVFVGRRNGVQQLYVRGLGDEEARPLADTEGAQVPAVSHDGQWVAFWSARAIRKAPVRRGAVADLAAGVTTPPMGMVWDESGRLFFGRWDDGRIWQVPPGGAPAAVTTVAEGERSQVLPCPLPGGRTILYTVRKREWSWGDEAIVAHTLATGMRKPLLQNAADARYLPSGHLVFLRRGKLFAVRFDAARLEVQGAEVAVLDNVAQALTAGAASLITGAGQFAVAPTGALAWIRGPVIEPEETGLATVDRRGQATPLPGDPRPYLPPLRLSPDSSRLAVLVRDLTQTGLWLYDLGRGVPTPLTQGGEAFWPRWSSDGRRLAFWWLKDGRLSLAVQPADGTSAPQPLLPGQFYPSSWSRSGRELVGNRAGDIVAATLDGDKPNVRPLFETPATEQWPELSPDERWLAYGSDRSGRNEVWVRAYPGLGEAKQVSIDGGSNPAWNPSKNKSELFFVGPLDAAGKRSMMVAEFDGGPPLRPGRPRPLFPFDPSSLAFNCTPVRCYDVSADGQRFYVRQSRPAAPRPPVTHIDLILNWVDEVKAKVRR